MGDAADPYVPMPAAVAGRGEEGGAPRWLAIVMSLVVVQFTGIGLVILGRWRLAVVWGVGGVVAGLPLLLSWPRLALVSLVVQPVVHFAGVVATAVARRGAFKGRPRPYLTAAVVLVGCVVVMLARRAWLMEAFQIPSGAMMPALLVGDHILVDKSVRAPARGDVIVFRYPPDPSVDYIKRVVGLPGETVSVHEGVFSIDGKPLEQRPLEEPCADFEIEDAACGLFEERAGARAHRIARLSARGFGGGTAPVTLGPGQYFVVGDNRDNSNDSRVWGPVPAANIKGRATTIWYSDDPVRDEVRWGRTGMAID